MNPDKRNKAKIYFKIPLIIFLLGSLIYALPFIKDIKNWGQMDWDQFTFWNAVQRESIVRYHQIPFWNPYECGGNVLFAHPWSNFLSPFFVLIIIFGPIIGIKAEMIIHLFIGLYGMFLISKELKLKKYSCYLCSFVYMFSSVYFLHLAEGHIEWMPMAFVPWIFLAYLRSIRSLKYIYISIFCFSLIFLAWSVYIFAVTVFLLLIYSILKSIQQKRIKHVNMFMLIFIGTLMLCSVKLIPMLEFLKDNPRKIESSEATEPSLVMSVLLSREQGLLYQNTKWTSPNQQIEFRGRKFEYGWHEYGAYIGWVPLALALIGICFFFRERWPLFLTALILLWIALGNGAFFNLWSILHRLPIYDSLHIPSRFIAGFLFCISLFSGFGLSKLETMSRKIHYKFLMGSIVLFVFFDLFLVNYPLIKDTFTIRPPKIKRYAEFKQRYRDFNLFPGQVRSSMYPAFLSNSGIINAYEVVHVKKANVKAIFDPGYRGEAYLVEGKGSLRISYFSPNKVVVEVDAKEPDRLVLNQNYYTGWKVKKDGRTILAESFKGLIATPILPGHQKIQFYYMPASFLIGLFVSTGFILLVAVSYIRKFSKYSRRKVAA